MEGTHSNILRKNTRFSDLGCLSAETLSVVENTLGLEYATPVQEATIPLFIGHKDVSVDACTGSGKTLSFVLPIVEKLRNLEKPLKKHQVAAIVISPTRELSKQILEVALPFMDTIEWASLALLVGGRDPQEDIQSLREGGCTFLIGTPGRIEDIFTRCTFLDVKTVEILVLDEADRLLDMGFQRQIDSIMKKIPKQRRTGLFSATQTDAVQALARAGLRNPVRVAVAVEYKSNPVLSSQATPSTLQVYYKIVDQRSKVSELFNFLATHAHEKIIVYFLTCACVDYFSLAISAMSRVTKHKEFMSTGKQNSIIHVLHGRMKQAAREASLQAFSTAGRGILLATDVAARGLDIPDVQWVLQYDAPQDPASFVHRCGRTARMGKSGNALILLTPQEESYVKFLELRKVPMKEQIHSSKKKIIGEEEALEALRRDSESDRLAMDHGMRAFVSYLRAYKEHVCKYIFRFSDLQMGWLASSFGVLRLPKMKEIKKAARLHKNGQLEGFSESNVDPNTIPFRDKMREKQRKEANRLKASQQTEKNVHTQSKASIDDRKKSNVVTSPNIRLTAAKRRTLESRQEMIDLDEDYTLWKKLKKGKITEQEYDHAIDIDGILNNEGSLLNQAVKKKQKRKRRKN